MGRFLDYFMRRKPQFCCAILLFALSSLTSAYFLSQHQDLAHHLRQSFDSQNDTTREQIEVEKAESANLQPTLATSAQTITQEIDQYHQNTPTYILENKNLDTAMKSEIIHLYNQLPKNEQKPYRTFIQQLQTGGAPRLQYHGQTSYPVNSEINFADLLTASDNEDGEIELTPENFQIEPAPRLDQPGAQNIVFKVTDRDQNTSTLTLRLVVYPLLDHTPQINTHSDTSGTSNSSEIAVPALGESKTSRSVGLGVNSTDSTPVASSGTFQPDYQKGDFSDEPTPINLVLLITITASVLFCAVLTLFFTLWRAQKHFQRGI